jgi:hypothetical protein
LRVILKNVFKGWLGVKNRSHHHMERAERLDPARRARKDEMGNCLQHGNTIYRDLRRTPDTAPATPPSNPAEPLTHRVQIMRLVSEYDAIANFPWGKGLIVSVCEFHYVSLITLTSIHTSSLVNLITVMTVGRKMSVSHNSKLVFKPMMSYVVTLSIPVWNIRMHNIHSYTDLKTVSDIVTKFIY